MTRIVTLSSAMPVIIQSSFKRTHEDVRRKCVKITTVIKTAVLQVGLNVSTTESAEEVK